MYTRKINDIENLIYECYSLDNKLTNDYCRRRKEGFAACCNDSITLLKDPNVEVFGIFDEGEFVGYFAVGTVKNEKELPGFFIVPEYRNRKNEVWNVIVKHMDGTFYNAIYINNKPAIEFCRKRGKEINSVDYENETHVIFEFKGE